MPQWARAALLVAALVMFYPRPELQFGAIILASVIFLGLKRTALRTA
jgi:hypothetical protein